MVRCDSAGSVASGWENETLPGAVNALGRETGSAGGMARLLSKPKPRGIGRKVIGEGRLTLTEASKTLCTFSCIFSFDFFIFCFVTLASRHSLQSDSLSDRLSTLSKKRRNIY